MHFLLSLAAAAFIAGGLSGCLKIPPAELPGPAPDRSAMVVAASMGRTWDAEQRIEERAEAAK